MAFTKRSLVKERLKRVEKDLAALDRELRRIESTGGEAGIPSALLRPSALARRKVLNGEGAADEPQAGGPAEVAAPVVRTSRGIAPDIAQEQGRRMQDDKRFANYLASSLETMQQPLRNERRIQRNKAIVMLAFVLLILFLILRAIFR